MRAFTLQDALYAVVVCLLHIHGLVLVELLYQVRGNGVGPLGVGVVAVVTPQQTVIVAIATGNLPCQSYATLSLLRCKAGNCVHIHELVISQITSIRLRHMLSQRVGLGTCYPKGR